MKKIIIINKKEGETPLNALENFRARKRLYTKVKMTYAGRLDPMASGLLLVLAGEETKNKEKYLKLPKEYEFKVLFGFATDTYDILGKVVKQTLVNNLSKKDSNFELRNPFSPSRFSGQSRPIPQKNKKASTSFVIQDLEQKIKENLRYFSGRFSQKYPPYSSKTVRGKALFEYARSGEVVEVLQKEVVVYELKFLKIKKIDNKKLLLNIEKRVKKVKGDFRQKEILKIWRRQLSPKRNIKFQLALFKIECSSGTYVRGIAHSLGEKIGLPALAFSIKRTKIGKWRL